MEERDLHRYKRLQRSNGKSIKMRKTLSEGSVFFVACYATQIHLKYAIIRNNKNFFKGWDNYGRSEAD